MMQSSARARADHMARYWYPVKVKSSQVKSSLVKRKLLRPEMTLVKRSNQPDVFRGAAPSAQKVVTQTCGGGPASRWKA